MVDRREWWPLGAVTRIVGVSRHRMHRSGDIAGAAPSVETMLCRNRHLAPRLLVCDGCFLFLDASAGPTPTVQLGPDPTLAGRRLTFWGYCLMFVCDMALISFIQISILDGRGRREL
jgi:hypothetical protein